MSVKYKRPEVMELLPLWQKIRDVIAGARKVKAAGTTYLPKPMAHDTSEENAERYKAYKTRAVFYGATARTHMGLIGQIFYRDPVIELPPLLNPLLESVDGGEATLEQQAKESCGLVLALGHGGLLTDYPNSEGGATLADLREGRVRPTITMYWPHQIINWRWNTLGAQKYLSLLVLEEEFDEEDDGFEAKRGVQWRVLRIVSDETSARRLQVIVYREGKRGMEEAENYFPTKGDGSPWDTIPFSPMGSENNDPIPDNPPMADLAELNIGHYRNSADYEESCFMVGQPTPWASGLTEDWVKDVWEGEVQLGSRAFLPLPENGSCGLIQAAPNTMPFEGMAHKEKQMVALGAKLVEQQSVQRTATESSQETVVENSVLSNVAKNVSAAYRRAIGFAQEFISDTSTFEFELNTDFEISTMSPQDRAQLLAEWQGGGITWGEYRFSMKKSGLAYEDDAKAQATIREELENSLNLDEDEEEEDGGQEE